MAKKERKTRVVAPFVERNINWLKAIEEKLERLAPKFGTAESEVVICLVAARNTVLEAINQIVSDIPSEYVPKTASETVSQGEAVSIKPEYAAAYGVTTQHAFKVTEVRMVKKEGAHRGKTFLTIECGSKSLVVQLSHVEFT